VDSLLESLGGHGGLFKIGKKGGKWNFHLQGQYRSPGLNLNDMGYLRQSDFIGERMEVSYRMIEPGKHLRDYNIIFYQSALWSFGGDNIGTQTGLFLRVRNHRLWSLLAKSTYDFSSLDTRELRGGPAIRKDPVFQIGLSLNSNSAKDLSGGISYGYSALGLENSMEHIWMFDLIWLPVKRLKISGTTQYSQRNYHQQYVTTLQESYSSEYIVGYLDRNTFSFTFRSELYVTPELSIQFYGSPYYSVGTYNRFRRVNESQARDIHNRLQLLTPGYDSESEYYTFSVSSEEYSFSNPDFTFMQFRSNLVFRWEYNLGSTLYVVWSHDRSGYESHYNPIRDITGNLFGIKGNHVFMVKLNFWFSV
jgi:hypothetical protein